MSETGDREPERLARVALGSLGEPGDPRMASLVAQLGAVAVHDHLARERDPGHGMLADVALRLAATQPARDLEQADRDGIRFVVPGDDEWPARLDDLMSAGLLHGRGGPPLGLWVKGPLRLDELEESVAVVGSRSATYQGSSAASEIAARVARAGYTVISGAAFGIDHAAHRGALAAAGRTVAVLACGVDRSYPKAHHKLLEHLGETTAVVSELGPGRSPTPSRFLTRNRLIAALARGTVVVEAAIRSGALNTATWASRLHRPLMGVPGAVNAAQSEGVHQLLRTGAATLVTNGEEVLEMLGPSGEHLATRRRARSRPRDDLPERQRLVLEAVPLHSPAGSDAISRTAGVGLLETQSTLNRLQAGGFVEHTPRGWVINDDEGAHSAAKSREVPTIDP
ncbi:DNA-protecting protein DprA [Nocardioides agariphilus]|uniref:DNA-protecting protein DprA n=1 Tax=Nocardioides agariphilus TaxID=433664 RepID=A0A930VSE0_9ACTN|nr:DNA-processing protein DprA [Nocardioides agariphilus]MBF4769985.1 DNA-protecting protein DprA [Nocardioides agariphilus]